MNKLGAKLVKAEIMGNTVRWLSVVCPLQVNVVYYLHQERRLLFCVCANLLGFLKKLLDEFNKIEGRNGD